MEIKTGGTTMQDMLMDMAMRGVIASFQELTKCMLAENSTNMAMADIIQSFFSPQHDKPFAHTDQLQADMYNPTPENSFERAVSGWLSFHLSPTEQFFGLHSSSFIDEVQSPDASTEVNVAKALAVRTETIHRIIQTPENFGVMAQSTREKIMMGVTAKTIDPDPLLTARLNFYPFRQLGIGTSNGLIHDIFMVCEDMSDFTARERFPEPLTNPTYWEERSVKWTMDAGGMKYYRVCMPVPVARRHVDDHLKADVMEARDRKKVLDRLFPLKDDKGYPGNVQWADVWFRRDAIMSVEVKDYRPIIVSSLSPPYNVMQFSRGQGEKALPLLMAITHALEKTVKAFERTFDPPWSVVDENARLGLNLTSDGISFKEAGTDDPKPLTLGSDMQQPITYATYLQTLFDRCVFLDVFELLNKSRMTKAEVQSRDSDDYRKMALYVVQDQADDLNPLVLDINWLVHQAQKKGRGGSDALADIKLRAMYTSDIAFANKNSLFNKVLRQGQLIEQIAKVGAVDAPINDVTDLPNYYSRVMLEAGESDILRTQGDRLAREQLRLSRQKIADNTAQAQALGASSQALGVIDQAAQGGGEGAGGAEAGA